MKKETHSRPASFRAGDGNPVRTTLGLLPVLAISTGMACPAFAQDVSDSTIRLDPLALQAGTAGQAATGYAVTDSASDKATAALINTPRTVTVITEKQIQERGATSLDDILRTTPGVTLGTGEGGTPFGTRPYIRGFEASTDISVDGIRSVGRATYEAFNLESVEINMGADGVASGRGSTGGSINLVSKQAREGLTFHEISGTLGTDDQYRATYDGNYDLGNGLAARLNLMYQDSDVPGRDYVTDERKGVAVSVTKRLDEVNKLSFSASRVKTDGIPDFGVPMANAAYVTATGDTSYGQGTKSSPYKPLENMDSSNFYGSATRDFRETTNDTVSVGFEHAFSNNFRVKSTLAYVGTEQDYVITRPSMTNGTTVARNMRSSIRDNNTTAFTTNFSGEFVLGGIEHSLSFGIEATKEKIRSASYSGGALSSTNLYHPTPNDPTTSPLVRGNFGNTTVTDTRSIYFFDTMTLDPNWLLNAGVRFDHYEVDNGTVTAKDDIFNAQLGVVYKLAPNASIYASYNTSSAPAGECASQAGGSGGSCNLSAATANTDPEKTKNYQIGTKWDLNDGRLSLTAAIFQTEKTNQRVENLIGEYELIGNTRSRGLELGAAGQVNDRWSVFAGYTYLDAEIVDDGPAANNDGNHPINTAKHSLALWTTYAVTDQWTVGGGANYIGKRYANVANTAELPGAWRFDLMTAYAVSENTNVQVNVNNVFDERIYDSSHQGLFATMQPGRSIALKLTHRF